MADNGELISWRLIHSKLGHIRKDSLKSMALHGTILGLDHDDIDWSDTQSCEICARANIRQHRLPRMADLVKLEPFEKGFVDLYGPINPPSIGGNKYAMLYCDVKSSFGMINLLYDKDLTSMKSTFKTWIITANAMGFKMEVINADSDSIFENQHLVKYLNDHEISIRYAPPGQHGKNGVIERMIQTITAMTRAMLIGSGLSRRFWSYAMEYALLIYNAVMKTKFKNDENMKYLSPYFIVANETPVFNFPIFGCLVIARDPKALKLPKMMDCGRHGAFLGFDSEHDNCIVMLNLETSAIVYSDDYVLLEDYYGKTGNHTDYYGMDRTCATKYKSLKMYKSHPFRHGVSSKPIPTMSKKNRVISETIDSEGEWEDVDDISEDEDDYVDYFSDPDVFDFELPSMINSVRGSVLVQSDLEMEACINQGELRSDKKSGTKEVSPLKSAPLRTTPHGCLSTLVKVKSTNSKDTVVTMDMDETEDVSGHRKISKRSIGDKYDRAMDRLINGYDSGFNMKDIIQSTIIANVQSRIVDGKIFYLPQNLREAMYSASWKDGFEASTKDELQSMFETNTFEYRLYEFGELPPGTKPVDQKWIFEIKTHSDGSIKRYKSRLVTRGFMQELYQSYIETYSPTTMKDSIRMVLALSAMYDLPTFQWDFKTAFLNGELEENEVIYSPIYDGYELFDIYKEYLPTKECAKLEKWLSEGKKHKLFLRMKKSAYGTKQAARNWYIMLNKWMMEHGYKPIKGDPSLYIKRDGDQFVIVAIYVDDCFGTSTDESAVKKLFKELYLW